MEHLTEQTVVGAIESMNLPEKVKKMLTFKVEELETALNLCLDNYSGHERNINQVKAELIWEIHQLYIGYANVNKFIHAELCQELVVYIADMN